MRNDDQPARQPRWLLHALGTLARVPSWLVVSAALTGAAVIAAFDIRGQHGAELRALYAIPAFVFTWRLGRPAGVAFAAVSLGTEVGVDLVLASHALENFTGYLPEFARFAAFLLVVEFAAETKNLVDREASDARADPLTSLLNRRGLREVGSRMCGIADRQRTPLAVLYADIDDFKTLNDRHGHATGDNALREFAAVLTTNLRQSTSPPASAVTNSLCCSPAPIAPAPAPPRTSSKNSSPDAPSRPDWRCRQASAWS